MKGWWKCPSGRASDVRWASLTFSARGLLATIEDMADGLGSIPIVGDLGDLAEVLGGRHGSDVADPLLVELLGAGLVAVDTDTHRLVIVPGPTDASTDDAPASDGPCEPHDGPALASEELGAPTRRDGKARPRKGPPRATNPLGLPADRWRRLRFMVQHRVGRFMVVPPGTTITELLAPTSPWHALLLADGRKGERNASERHIGTERNASERHIGTHRNATSERNGTPLPPSPSPSEREGETREKHSLSDASARNGTPDRNGTERHIGTERNGSDTGTERPIGTGTEQGTGTVCTTTERIGGGMLAGEVLMMLRGEARLRLTATTSQERELERVLVDVAARGQGWERAGLGRLAAHLRDGHATTRDGSAWRPTLAQLRGADGAWARLLSLYDESAGCSRCEAGPSASAWEDIEDVTEARLKRERAAAAAAKSTMHGGIQDHGQR